MSFAYVIAGIDNGPRFVNAIQVVALGELATIREMFPLWLPLNFQTVL